MALGQGQPDASRPSPLILEAVPGLRDALLRCDGRAVAAAQVHGGAVFGFLFDY
jgi:hypothetical protein